MTNETSETTDRVVIVPEVSVPAGTVDRIRDLTQKIEASGLIPAFGEVYRDVRPALRIVREASGDGVSHEFDRSTGWLDLWGAVMELAGACMALTDAHDADMTWPAWMDADHVHARDVEAIQRLYRVDPGLAERFVAGDGVAVEEVRTILDDRDD